MFICEELSHAWGVGKVVEMCWDTLYEGSLEASVPYEGGKSQD